MKEQNSLMDLLHGGASCALAETVGSVASALVIDLDKFYCVGLEINANHMRSVTKGFVTGKCNTTYTWEEQLMFGILKFMMK